MCRWGMQLPSYFPCLEKQMFPTKASKISKVSLDCLYKCDLHSSESLVRVADFCISACWCVQVHPTACHDILNIVVQLQPVQRMFQSRMIVWMFVHFHLTRLVWQWVADTDTQFIVCVTGAEGVSSVHVILRELVVSPLLVACLLPQGGAPQWQSLSPKHPLSVGCRAKVAKRL